MKHQDLFAENIRRLTLRFEPIVNPHIQCPTWMRCFIRAAGPDFCAFFLQAPAKGRS